MKTALTREGRHVAAGTTFGHVHGDEVSPDPSSVDEVGRPGVPHDRPGVPHNHGEGTHNR